MAKIRPAGLKIVIRYGSIVKVHEMTNNYYNYLSRLGSYYGDSECKNRRMGICRGDTTKCQRNSKTFYIKHAQFTRSVHPKSMDYNKIVSCVTYTRKYNNN